MDNKASSSCPATQRHLRGSTRKSAEDISPRDLFRPQAFIGSSDMFVNVGLGKVALKEEERQQIKAERMHEMEGDAAQEIRVVTDELDLPWDPELEAETPCPCACWREVEALKEVVREQGVRIQNLSNIVVNLLGKQFQSPQNVETSGGPPKEGAQVLEPSEMVSLTPSKPTQDCKPTHVRQETDSDKAPDPNRVPIHSKSLEDSARPPSQFPIPAKRKPSERSRDRSHKRFTPEDIGTTSKNPSSKPSASPNLPDRSLKKKGKSKKQFKCNLDHCHKTFSSQDSLNRHVKIRHDGIRYKCAHCEASFCSKDKLQDHEKIHAEGRPLLKCDLCGTEVVSDMSLRAHLISRHHTRDPKKMQQKKSARGKRREETMPK